ncbi:hypothetical protein OIU85_023298, partial [Salix viminalis]
MKAPGATNAGLSHPYSPLIAFLRLAPWNQVLPCRSCCYNLHVLDFACSGFFEGSIFNLQPSSFSA